MGNKQLQSLWIHNMHIFFLTTGGTIDKDYPHATGGWAFEFGDEAAVARILRERLAFPKPSFTHEIIETCRKDSLEITNEDREALWKTIVKCQLKQHEIAAADSSEQESRRSSTFDYGFVITHGTDTMLETGKYLQQQIEARVTKELPPPSIVVTGAMRPERFANSDAPINLGMAVAAVQMMVASGKASGSFESAPGCHVHVAMHGIVKPVHFMQRDNQTGRFY